MTSTPTSNTWTLRLKHNATTLFIYAEATEPLRALKADLYTALQQTRPHGSLNGHPLPSDASDLLLARPCDMYDLSQGWIPLQPQPSLYDEDDDPSYTKEKGKASALGATSSKSGKNKENEALSSLGLKDNMVIAFKFRGALEERPKVGEGGDFLVTIEEEDEVWDVKVPTIEETYAEDDAFMLERREEPDGEKLLDELQRSRSAKEDGSR